MKHGKSLMTQKGRTVGIGDEFSAVDIYLFMLTTFGLKQSKGTHLFRSFQMLQELLQSGKRPTKKYMVSFFQLMGL
ncbi:MAG: hypothetical protein CM15mP51_14360 [Porticoccaceae bacterium]|nr:MAG: hypothetical protein CM15mP51_14360 [Porticoccaceae bacterium]